MFILFMLMYCTCNVDFIFVHLYMCVRAYVYLCVCVGARAHFSQYSELKFDYTRSCTFNDMVHDIFQSVAKLCT